MRAPLLLIALVSPACSYDWEGLSSGGGGDGGNGGECNVMFASNIDPCELEPTELDWTISDPLSLDLDEEATGESIVQFGGAAAWAIHARSLTVEVGGSLTISGGLPLILVVDEIIALEGQISVFNGADLATCETDGAQPGGEGEDQCGGGGGGGGFEDVGGEGGGCPDGVNASTPAAGGAMALGRDLEPLRGGCSGAAGGRFETDEIVVAAGGAGGGAIQLIAGDRIIMGPGGGIIAVGQGGAGGDHGETNEVTGGGGGGGSGGGVLLEAPLLILDDGSSVCATGGGGGSGGDKEVGADGEPGAPGECGDQPATGGDPSGDAGGGGRGGTTGSLSGESGETAASMLGSGGGGGGAAGVIRIRTAPGLVAPDNWSPVATIN